MVTGTSYRVRIVISDTGRGLWRDAQLVAGVIRDAGMEPLIETYAPQSDVLFRLKRWVEVFKTKLPYRVQGAMTRIQGFIYRRVPDSSIVVTIHMQRVYSRYVPGPHQNWLIPNPEWYERHYLPYLTLMDRVICKTRDAESVFRQYHRNVAFTGFSGLLPEIPEGFPGRDPRRFLHVAGNNPNKGTPAVVCAWARHPDWPILDLVIEDRSRLPVLPDNIRIHERIGDVELEMLRRECGIVLAPSEAEGFGHVILDAMAWGQVVITVDAPPMNELVGRDRGILVNSIGSRPCRMGTRYFVDLSSLEASVYRALEMTEGEFESLSKAARSWVCHNHASFRQRLCVLLEELSVVQGDNVGRIKP